MKKFLAILMVLAMTSFIFTGCLPTTNTGPVFTSTPGTTATVGTAYSYTATATDADADTVTFSVSGPTGMAISGAVITWTPTTAQIGTHSVVVTASDGTNATAQTATITVSAAAVTGTIVSIPAIPGVTAPVYGAAPDLTVTASTQYTGVTTWKTAAGVAAGATFEASTVYIATITLTAKTGFTLTGVTANFFTVAGAAGVSNPADSGVVTATFATTAAGGAIVSIPEITVVAPVTGVAPATAITATVQYTGTVTWKTAAGVAVGTTFASGTVYVATITLIPVTGFTFTGVTANFFTEGGAVGVSNPVNSGVVTATYAATAAAPTVLSAAFTDSGTITIVYSMDVTMDATIGADYTAGTITGPVVDTYIIMNIARDPAAPLDLARVAITVQTPGGPGVGQSITGTSTGTIAIAATVVDATLATNPLVAKTQVIAAGGW